MIIEDQNRPGDKPRGSASANIRRLPEVIAENKDWVIAQWLERVNANAELIRVSLSDAERRDHVPDLLDEAVATACGHPVKLEARQKAAEIHGTLRYHQKYSVSMLILEAQLLQDVIAECIRDNFPTIDLSNLIPDMAKTSQTITAELRESARAYMKQYEWQVSDPMGSLHSTRWRSHGPKHPVCTGVYGEHCHPGVTMSSFICSEN